MLLLNVGPVWFAVCFINSATTNNAATYTAAAVDEVKAAFGWSGFVSSGAQIIHVYKEGENMKSSVSRLLFNPFLLIQM